MEISGKFSKKIRQNKTKQGKKRTCIRINKNMDKIEIGKFFRKITKYIIFTNFFFKIKNGHL